MDIPSLSPQALDCLRDLANGFNGELSAGLSGKGDTGLKESEKLALVPAARVRTDMSRLDSVSDWDICTDDDNASRVLVAMAHAAHVARTLGLDGQQCSHAGGPELAKAIEVTAAYTVVWAGLTGYFQANPMYVTKEDAGKGIFKYTYRETICPVPTGDHVSERDTCDPLFDISDEKRVVAAHDEPAQSSKDMTREEQDTCMALAIAAIGKGKDNWLSSYCTPEQATNVLTIILATKFNWYTTNHHVGQSHATKYIVKAVTTTYRGASTGPDTIHESIKDSVWKVGHWASTHLCLRVMDMRTGVRVVVHPAGSGLGKVVLSADYRVRCDGAPAGMAKVALVHTTIMLHRSNHMWLLAPSLRSIINCHDVYRDHLAEVKRCREQKLVDPRCKNHEGGNYLTGGKPKTAIAFTLAPLGVIGSFLFWKFPNSTLTASPLISTPQPNKVRLPRYMNYPDFDAVFDDACKSARDTKMKMTAAVGEFIGRSTAGVSCSEKDYVEFMSSFGIKGADAKKKYHEAALVFEVDPSTADPEDAAVPQPGPSSAPPPVPPPAPAPAPAPAPDAGAKKRKHEEISVSEGAPSEGEESDEDMPTAP